MKIKQFLLIITLACSLNALSMGMDHTRTKDGNQTLTFSRLQGLVLQADLRRAASYLGLKNGYNEAIPRLQSLCAQENEFIKAEALFLLGRTYLYGFGDCPPDRAKGKELIYQASIQTDNEQIQQKSIRLLNSLNRLNSINN